MVCAGVPIVNVGVVVVELETRLGDGILGDGESSIRDMTDELLDRSDNSETSEVGEESAVSVTWGNDQSVIIN